jgi:Mg2+ and Co2+ transporter CorA
MLKTLLCDENNQFLVVENPTAIDKIIRQDTRLLWLDLEKPTAEEFQMIEREFNLHPLAIEDAMMRHQRPKVDQYEDFYFVVFYAVASEEPEKAALLPGRRGFRNTNFLRVGMNGYTAGNGQLPELGEAQEPSGWTAHSPAPSPASNSIGTTQVPSQSSRQESFGNELGEAQEASDASPGNDQGNGAAPQANSQDDNERIVLRELSMFMGKNYLITVHNDAVKEIDEAAKRWRQNVEVITGVDAKFHRVRGTRPLTPEEQKGLESTGRERVEGAKPDGQPDAKDDKKRPAPMNWRGTSQEATQSKKSQGSRNQPLAPRNEGEAAGSSQVAVRPETGEKQGFPAQHPQAGTREQTNDIGILLYSLLDTIVDDYFPVIDTIVDRVEDLEEQIFEKYNQQAIESIFVLKKDLLALRKVLAPERDVLNVLTRRDIPIFEQHTLVYFQDIYDHVVRITDSIDTYRDLLSSALDSFLSMQSNRLNITVQTLTSVSIILMSIAAVTGWYGMNFQFMPELHQPWAYPAVIVVVATISLLEFSFFKRRGWL